MIIAEEDACKQASFISLITLTKEILGHLYGSFGMESPEHM